MSCQTGDQLLDAGVRWIKDNPEAWSELQTICLRIEAAEKDGRKVFASITRGSVYMYAQILGIEVSNDETFKRNNNLWSVLARYMVELHPQLHRVIETRECELARYIRAHGLPEI